MYFCNGFKFDTYEEAAQYADILLYQFRIYRAIYTRAEVEAHFKELLV